MITRARKERVSELRGLSARLGRQAEEVAVRAGADIDEPQAALLEALNLIESDLLGRVETQPVAVSRRGLAARALLVDRAAGGDADAWNDLVREFGGLVWAVARSYRLSEADAAEVNQATWLSLLRHIRTLDNSAHVGAWLATTARRESHRLLMSSRKVVPSDDLPELISEEPEPEAAVLAAEDHDLRLLSARKALGYLTERERKVLWLTAADPSPSYREISAALEIPVGSIGPIRSRALSRLRREMRIQGIGHAQGLRVGFQAPSIEIDAPRGTVRIELTRSSAAGKSTEPEPRQLVTRLVLHAAALPGDRLRGRWASSKAHQPRGEERLSASTNGVRRFRPIRQSTPGARARSVWGPLDGRGSDAVDRSRRSAGCSHRRKTWRFMRCTRGAGRCRRRACWELSSRVVDQLA